MTDPTELLRRALEAWDDEFQNLDNASIFSDIRAYLNAPNDKSAWPIDDQIAERIAKKQCVSYEVVQLIAREILNTNQYIPKKPITEEEIPYKGSHDYSAFLLGIRFAERHHKISGSYD